MFWKLNWLFKRWYFLKGYLFYNANKRWTNKHIKNNNRKINYSSPYFSQGYLFYFSLYVFFFSFLYPGILESWRCERTRKKNIYIFIYTFQQSFQRSILQRYLTIQHQPNKIALSSIQYSRLTFSWSLWKIEPSLGP